jgi:hypothetical protein
MNWWPIWLLAFAGPVLAQTNVSTSPVVTIYTTNAPSTNLTAAAIMERTLANRPVQDLALKARLFVTREDKVPLEILVRNTPTETRTIYRGDQTNLLVVQPVRGTAKFYLRGTGQLAAAGQGEKLLKSEFLLYDLAFPFLRWPNLNRLGDDRVRGRDCYLIEATSGATNEPYAKAKLWIDQTYFALLRAEGYNADGALVKRFAVTSFKKIDEIWIPRGVETARVPVGQSLPSETRSRLEIYEGDYSAKLPPEMFAEDQFGAASR